MHFYIWSKPSFLISLTTSPNLYKNADTHATTVADATSDAGRAIYIIYTGTLDSACTITIGPDTLKRVHIIKNGTSGSQNILIKQGSGGGAAVTIPPGDTKVVSLDGGGSSAIVTDVFASLSVVDLKVQDDLTLSSDSAILGFGADTDTTLTHTDGTGLTLNSTNKLTFGDAASFVHQSSDGVLTVAGEATIALTASTAVTVSHDLKLNTDGAILGFGQDNDATLTHVDDGGLILGGTTPTLTIGDAGAEDAKIVFDGNAQDFYIGLDDSEDDLVIGKGSALGTTPALAIDENLLVTISDDILVTDRAYGGALEAENDGSFNLAEGNDLTLTIDNLTDGGSLDIVQDGENNDIDFDIVSMDGFIIDIDQVGSGNSLDVNVDGRTSNGSSMYFNQTGNNKSYSNTLWCGHSFCTITVNQN